MSPGERLEAARFFAENAQPSHERELRDAIARETVLWIKTALKRALARISADADGSVSTAPTLDRDDMPADYAAQVYSEALETTASLLIHEIEPILGALRVAAEVDVSEFATSDTRRHLDRMDDLLAALSRLRKAASSARIEEFALDELLQRCIGEANIGTGVVINKAGPQPCIAEGDSKLVALCFGNGLRNAIESTKEAGAGPDRPITVAWDSTELDYWISVLDVGVGFRGNVQRAFDIGTTTKSGHLGMGLAIAQQAAASLGGSIALIPKERGVRFEMRWRKKAPADATAVR